jgi:hypothetical protein
MSGRRLAPLALVALFAATASPAGAQQPGEAPSQRLAPSTPEHSVDSTMVIMREAFNYERAGRRDPFLSLMGTEELRPLISELRLVGVLYNDQRQVAILRDIETDQQYRVTVGTSVGRMRVAQIRPKSVIFNIEEFGFSRRDSLVLGDTSTVRRR